MSLLRLALAPIPPFTPSKAKVVSFGKKNLTTEDIKEKYVPETVTLLAQNQYKTFWDISKPKLLLGWIFSDKKKFKKQAKINLDGSQPYFERWGITPSNIKPFDSFSSSTGFWINTKQGKKLITNAHCVTDPGQYVPNLKSPFLKLTNQFFIAIPSFNRKASSQKQKIETIKLTISQINISPNYGLLALDPHNDIAVLEPLDGKEDEKLKHITGLTLAQTALINNDSYRPGFDVFLIGSSDGVGGKVSSGKIQHFVTEKNQSKEMSTTIHLPFEQIRHCATSSPGDSGGPLLSASDGKILGINYGASPNVTAIATSATVIRQKLKEWGFELIEDV